MITSYQLFCEAIKLSDAKYYTEMWYNKGGNKLHQKFFQDLFKGKPDTKYRLYYPFQIDDTEDKVDSLQKNIVSLLTDEGYTDINYIGNKTVDKYKRTVKISSVLSKLKETELLNKYNANLNRSNTKSKDEYKIVISRHPVDLAGMSTGRGWTSCMNLKDGSNKHYVFFDVIYGTLVAYIIKSTDTNIQNPIARCLIKPFLHDRNDKYTIYLPEHKIYGTLSDKTQNDFLEFITNWCNVNFNKDSKDGKYLKNSNLYSDGGYDTFTKTFTNLEQHLKTNYEYNEKTNTVIIDENLHLDNTNLTSLNINGLKVIVGGDLDIRYNPELTSIKGIENFDVKGNVDANWDNFKDVTLKQIILYQYKSDTKWIDDNTIEVKGNLYLSNIKSLDTDGLKIIVNGNLYIIDNLELTTLDGLENFELKGNIYADWKKIKDVTLREIILYENKNSIKWINDNTIEINDNLDLKRGALKSLDTDGLKIIVNGNLDITNNPELTSLDGLENFEVKGNIYADWKNIKGIALRQLILYKHKSDMKWIDDNTIKISDCLELNHCGLKSLDTDGLKVIVNDSLLLGDNPELTSLKGIENFKFKGQVYANWENFTNLTLKQILLYIFRENFVFVDDNTISFISGLHLQHYNLSSLDTGGLKVIVNGFLNLKNNPELTSLKGIENFEVKGNFIADWENFTDVSLRNILLYQYKSDIKWIDDNTIEMENSLYLIYGLKSLDTDGLKVIVKGDLNLMRNPELTSLKGIENFEVKDKVLINQNLKDEIVKYNKYKFQIYYTT